MCSWGDVQPLYALKPLEVPKVLLAPGERSRAKTSRSLLTRGCKVHKCSAEGSGLVKRKSLWRAGHAKGIAAESGTFTPGAMRGE